MDYVEKTGKTAEEAIAEALKELNISEEEAEITVLDQGKPGVLFGLGARSAKVRVAKKEMMAEAAAVAAAVEAEKVQETAQEETATPGVEERQYVLDEDAIAKAKDFLQKVFATMQLEDAIIEKFVNPKNNAVTFRMHGEDMGILIGKHGQTLDSLQYLTNLVANKVSQGHVRIILDVEDYRDRREETLIRLARRLADKVKREGTPATLESMNAHERKIIHTALQGDRRVTTFSEGEEPNRHIVIKLKD